jgi:hypothetical protein
MKNKNMFTMVSIVLIIAIAGFALSQNADAPNTDTPEIQTPDTYIGLTIEQAMQYAEQNGDMFRVVSIDGEPQMATMDYRVGRINASTVDGVVSEFNVEGK